jgi:hypothetical protein
MDNLYFIPLFLILGVGGGGVGLIKFENFLYFRLSLNFSYFCFVFI